MFRNGSVPSLATSQQSHIDDLVKRNRALEENIKLLQEQVEKEKSDARDALTKVHAKWREEQREWRKLLETLQACHRIAHLDLSTRLSVERVNCILQRDVTRVEKVAVAQRDYMIHRFQARERELEEEVEVLNEDHERSRSSANSRILSLEKELQSLQAEKENLETSVTTLRKSTVNQKASSDAASTKLERTKLQLEKAQVEIEELQRSNSDMKRTITKLEIQIENWQTLEGRGDAEVDSLRRQRAELEIELQALRDKTSDKEAELLAQIAKEKSKIGKLKSNLEEWKGSYAKLQDEFSQQQSTSKRIDTTTRKKAGKQQTATKRGLGDSDSDDAAPDPPQAEIQDVEQSDDNEIEEIAAPTQKSKGKRKAKATISKRLVANSGDESEPEEQPAKKKRGRPRKNAPEKPDAPSSQLGKRRAISPEADDFQEEREPSHQKPEETLAKRKRKINVFPAIAPEFNFASLGGTGNVDIPTNLSPVKTAEYYNAKYLSTFPKR